MLDDINICESSLVTVSEVLREALFELSTVQYDHAQERFTLPLWVPVEGMAEYARICCCLYWKRVPTKLWVLTFSGVVRCMVEAEDQVPRYEISGLEFLASRGELVIDTHYSLRLKLRTNEVNGLLREGTTMRSDLSCWFPVLGGCRRSLPSQCGHPSRML